MNRIFFLVFSLFLFYDCSDTQSVSNKAKPGVKPIVKAPNEKPPDVKTPSDPMPIATEPPNDNTTEGKNDFKSPAYGRITAKIHVEEGQGDEDFLFPHQYQGKTQKIKLSIKYQNLPKNADKTFRLSIESYENELSIGSSDDESNQREISIKLPKDKDGNGVFDEVLELKLNDVEKIKHHLERRKAKCFIKDEEGKVLDSASFSYRVKAFDAVESLWGLGMRNQNGEILFFKDSEYGSLSLSDKIMLKVGETYTFYGSPRPDYKGLYSSKKRFKIRFRILPDVGLVGKSNEDTFTSEQLEQGISFTLKRKHLPRGDYEKAYRFMIQINLVSEKNQEDAYKRVDIYVKNETLAKD